MKLLQVNNVATLVGGTGACARSIVEALPEWEHTILFARPGPVREGFGRQFTCGVLRGISGLPELIESERQDVILFHNIAARGIGQQIPASTLTVYYQHSGRRSRAAARLRCDQGFVVSRYLAQQAGLRAEQVLYQPVSCPPTPPQKGEGTRGEQLRIGRLCTPHPRKWLRDEVLPLYEELAAAHPDVIWEFVGCPLGLQPALGEACRGKVRFQPASPGARSLLWEWQAMLYDSSLAESYGRTVCEAQQAGCIPIVSRRGGFIEQIEQGRTGFLCDGADEFAAAVATLCDERRRTRLQQAATAAGTERGSPAVWRDRFLERISECGIEIDMNRKSTHSSHSGRAIQKQKAGSQDAECNQSWRGVIPIYITCFNWLSSTRKLAAYFDDVPGTEVILVDNASTYEPLLEWYAGECPYRVIRLPKNGGKHAPWNSGAVLPPPVHRAFFGSDYYVVTDPDLSLEDCPKDLLNVLISGLTEFPKIAKVGLSLEIEDLPADSPIAGDVKKWERKYWRNRKSERFFAAAVDTTFALYSIDKPHTTAKCSRGNALRSDRPYTARHLPWYIDLDDLTGEQEYYLRRARNGVWGRHLQRLIEMPAETVQCPGSRAQSQKLSPLDPRPSSLDLHAASAQRWRVTEKEAGRYQAERRISDALLQFLPELLESCRPRSILELGPGLSSLVFYRYAADTRGVEYIAIDQPGRAHDRFVAHMKQPGFDTSNIFCSPLMRGFYHTASLEIPTEKTFDLLMIDGPAGSRGRGTPQCIDFVRAHSTRRSIFITDDTHRRPERRLVAAIEENFGRDTFERLEIPDLTFPPRVTTILGPRQYLQHLTGSGKRGRGVHV